MKTLIEKETDVELAVTKNYTATDGENLAITFNRFSKVREDISDAKIGELVGHIDIVYPIAGLNVNLTLEVQQGYSDYFETNSGIFKVPFVEEFVAIMDLEFEAYCNGISGDFIGEDTPPQCICGGLLIPYYEEYPSWTYCSNFCNDN